MAGSQERPSRNSAGAAIVLLLVAGMIAAYFLTYAAMLRDVQFAFDSGLLIRPVYRWQHPLVEVAFTPANWCDRRVRPSRWRLPKPIPYPESASNTFILYER